MFNSAKNKYDDDEINNNLSSNNNININTEIKLNSNSSDSFNENENLDTTASNALISRDSNLSNKSINTINCNNSNKFKNKSNGFLGENEIPNVKKIYKEEDAQDLLTWKIKYALKKMEQEYLLNNIQGNNNYNYIYCEYFFSNKHKILENCEEILINKNSYKFNRKDKQYNNF